MNRTFTRGAVAFAFAAALVTAHAADVAAGKGRVNKIDAGAATLNLTHEAIPALKWPAMTMDFHVADKKLLAGVKPGQAVTFGLAKDPAGGYAISHIEPAN